MLKMIYQSYFDSYYMSCTYKVEISSPINGGPKYVLTFRPGIGEGGAVDDMELTVRP